MPSRQIFPWSGKERAALLKDFVQLSLICLLIGATGCGTGVRDLNAGISGHAAQVETKDDPTFPQARAGGVQYVRSKSTGPTAVVLDASASLDPAGKGLTYSWKQLTGPPVVLDFQDTAQARFTVPANSQRQQYDFEVTVADSDHTSTDRASVIVIGAIVGKSVAIRQHPYIGSWVRGNVAIDSLVGGDGAIYLPGTALDIANPRDLKRIPVSAVSGPIAKYTGKKLYSAAMFGSSIVVTDVAVPAQARAIGTWTTTGVQLFDIAVDEKNVYFAGNLGTGTSIVFGWFPLTMAFGAFDISTSAIPPSAVKYINIGGNNAVSSLVVSNNKAFLAQSADGVKVVDLANTSGVLVSSIAGLLPNGVGLQLIAVNNGYLYIADGRSVNIYSTNTLFKLATVQSTAGGARRVAADNNFLYVANDLAVIGVYELASGFYKPVGYIKRLQPDRLLPVNGILYVGDSGRGVFAFDPALLAMLPSAVAFSDANFKVHSINELLNSRLYSTTYAANLTAGAVQGVRILNVGRDPVVSIAGNDFSNAISMQYGLVSEITSPPILVGLERDAMGSNYLDAVDFTSPARPLRSSVVAEGAVQSMKLDGSHLYTLYTTTAAGFPQQSYQTGIAAYDLANPGSMVLTNKVTWNDFGFKGGMDVYLDGISGTKKLVVADFSGVRIFDNSALFTPGATVILQDSYLSGRNNSLIVDGDNAVIAADLGLKTYDFSTAINLRTDLRTVEGFNAGDEIQQLRKLPGGKLLAAQSAENYLILDVKSTSDISMDAGLRFDAPPVSVAVVNDRFYFVDAVGAISVVDIAPPVLTAKFTADGVKPGATVRYQMAWKDMGAAVEAQCVVSVGQCSVERNTTDTTAAVLAWQLPADATEINFALRAIVGNNRLFTSAVTYLAK